MSKRARLGVGVVAVLMVALLGPRVYTVVRYRGHIYAPARAPAAPVAIVFGAGLRRDGQPTPVLADRVRTAAELYYAGKVSRLLLSGSRSGAHNEPEAMRRAALALGVPDEALLLDDGGRRTYDTCYRARAVFGVTEAVLITQSFHLPRALYLCNALGVTAEGVSADRRAYRRASLLIWNVREVFATAAAWWDVSVARPAPLAADVIRRAGAAAGFPPGPARAQWSSWPRSRS